MAYNYTVIFQLVDEEASDIDFQSKIGKQKIEDAKDYFNGLKTRNPKNINELEVIGKHRLKFSISSEEILQVPTKALATFTRRLIEVWPEIGEHAIGKRIFKGISSDEINEDVEINNIDDISDVDALKLLIDIFINKSSMTAKDMRLKNRAIADVKKSLLNYIKDGGIIKGGR